MMPLAQGIDPTITAALIALAVVSVPVIYFIVIYNRIVGLRQHLRES